jgi:hypothetical protein
MALNAETTYYEGFFAVHILDRNYPSGIGDYPDDRDWPFDFFYEDEKLAAGEYELVGIEVLDVSLITDEWLAELEKLDLPRIDVPEANLTDATFADVLRWARRTYPSRYRQAAG